MKRSFIGKLCLAAMAMVGFFQASAQQMPPLPQDSALIVGRLDNGLTYYIRHNETPSGQADFYIAQKVGSILEEDEQQGLAHFLEHMCFNGTKHFPGKGIIEYLESIGVKFGRNLNAYTSVDETVYNISSVPVERTSVQDSCLLILHDWACDLTLAPEEIEAERGVIHEEWRMSNQGSMRIFTEKLPIIYPNSRYGHRLPIGTIEVIDNFPRQALVDYYHKWYRPDQQAIIVVGDIDPAYIEAKIKELFGPIQMPENAAERTYFEVEDNDETIYAIGKDTEMQNDAVLMFFKSDDIIVPEQLRNTPAFYLYDYMQAIIQMMMNQRYDDLTKNPDCSFAAASIDLGDFFLARTKGALTLEVVGKTTDILASFSEAYRELIRADQGGFTIGEYERARQELLSRINRQYNERGSRTTDSYSNEYVKLFVEGVPAPGIEVEKPLYEQFAQMIDVNSINQYFQSLIQDDNRVLLALLPDKEGFAIPTEEQFATAIEGIDAETLEPYKDEVRTDPLIASLPAPGSITATTELPEWGATQYTLSNGVKVIVKKTDLKAGEIIMEGVALGKGESTLNQDDAASISFAPVAASTQGLNDYSNSDLQKYLAGKQVAVSFGFSDYSRSISGNTIASDLPTFMEILYSYFTGFNITESEFAATQNMYAGILENQESQPQFQWLKKVKAGLITAKSQQSITSAIVREADRQTILDIYRGMLSNAADYTLYFVGDIDTETFIPLMEQYIATLPADAATATTGYDINSDFEYLGGNVTDISSMEMETPQSWVFIAINGKMPYTAKNKAIGSIVSQILSKRLLNKVREEMGATYSLGASGGLNRTSQQNTFYQIAFPMKPEMREETLPIIREMVNAMKSDITEEELRPAIEYMLKDARESREKNEDWASAMSAYSLNGVQTYVNAEETLNSITIADVQNFVSELLEQGNYREIILDPIQTETPAE